MERNPFPKLDCLDADAILLAGIVARHSYLPHPDVIAQVQGPVFPSIRGNTALGTRGKVIQFEGRELVLDDNTTPRWALLVAHGLAPSIPSASKGWSLAHVWPRAQCRMSYTALPNLALVPECFATLTDKSSPVAAYFRFHAWDRYGWHPPYCPIPEEPEGYAQISWRYFDPVPNAAERIDHFLKTSQNDWVLKINVLRQNCAD